MRSRVDRHELVRRERVGIGEMEDDAVVRPQRMRLDAVLLAQQRAQCEPPGRMHARAEGREHAQAPVADLVAEALDDDRAVRGQDAGGRLLLPQVLHERAGGALVAGVQPGQPLHRALVVQRGELALQPPDGAPELDGTARPARPSRTAPVRAGRARGRRSRDRARSARCARPRRPAGRPGPRAPRAPSPRRARPRARRRRRGTRRRDRGQGSCPRSRWRCAGRPRVRAARPSCAPRRCAGAARRTRPTGSARRAGRARSRVARA